MNNATGASLYVPATHPKLSRIADGRELPFVRTLIFCTEDAVAERDLDRALGNLAAALTHLRRSPRPRHFVRVRDPGVLERTLAMQGAHHLAGFVIPKVTCESLPNYLHLVRHTAHHLMITLETAEVFCDVEMRRLRDMLLAPDVRPRILALRIGGNDLLALLGLRRPRDMTIYRTPIGPVIARLVTTFRPYGFALTAPVFEHLDLQQLLDEEVHEDLAHGLVGKTAIHPDQVDAIERHYRVDAGDLAAARVILDPSSPAVFRMHGSMCEVATHRQWALCTIQRALDFGSNAATAPVALRGPVPCATEGQPQPVEAPVSAPA